MRTGEEVGVTERKDPVCECEIVCHPKSDVMCATCEQAKGMETSLSLVGESETQPLTGPNERKL